MKKDNKLTAAEVMTAQNSTINALLSEGKWDKVSTVMKSELSVPSLYYNVTKDE